MLFGLFGCGGFGREVMPIARETIEAMQPGAQIVFIETSPTPGKIVNGHRVISEEEFRTAADQNKRFNIAVANSQAREDIASRLSAAGARPLTLYSRQSTIYDACRIGEGSIICASCIVTSNAVIGRYFHCNIQSYVAHDCEIGDFVTFAPRVACNGNVTIGEHTYVGTSAVIKQGAPGTPVLIGARSTIGMGAVVTKSVPPGETWVGNPARLMERRS